jgi:hypothetical protein
MAQREFRRATSLTNQPRTRSSTTEEEKWVPPPRNIVKINWDASVDTVKHLSRAFITSKTRKHKL